MRHGLYGRLGAALACAAGLTAALFGGEPDGADLDRLLARPVELLNRMTASPETFRTRGRAVQNEAYALAVYAQVGMSGRDDGSRRRLAALRDGAVAVADAAGKKDHDGARRQVKLLAAPDGLAPGADVPLQSLIPRVNLMEQAGLVRGDLAEHEEMKGAEWSADRARVGRGHASWKLAALMRATEAHAPDKDQAPGTKRTRRYWLDCAGETERASRELLRVAGASKPEPFLEALKKVDDACARCHEVFRTE